jgi:DnaJ domain
MGTKRARTIGQVVREVDKTLFDLTGTHLKTVVKKSFVRAGEYVSKAMFSPDHSVEQSYAVLQVRPDASNEVVKAAFRSLVRQYHSDTGIQPDDAKYAAVVAAYRTVMFARLQEDGGTPPDPGEVNERDNEETA